MASSEIVDSVKFSGKRTNFSQTCNLLSQFLKEKGGFGEVSLVLSQNLEHKVVPTGTMNLLPMIEKSPQNQVPPNSDSDPKNLNSPLNMFRHRQEEAMKKSDVSGGTKLVAESAPLTIFYGGQVIVFNDFPADKANEIIMLASKSSAAAAQNHHFSASAHRTQPRKNSLARFLEKRKDRTTANAPYPARKPAAPPLNNEEWLRLGPQLPI